MEPTTVILCFSLAGNVVLFGLWLSGTGEHSKLTATQAESNFREQSHLKQLETLRSEREAVTRDARAWLADVPQNGYSRAEYSNQRFFELLRTLSQIIRDDRAEDEKAWPFEGYRSCKKLDSFFGEKLPNKIIGRLVAEDRRQNPAAYNRIMSTFPRDVVQYFERLEEEVPRTA